MGSMGTVTVSPNRYQVLNPNVIPQGFVNNREASELLLGSTNLDVNEYKIGHIKVGSSPSALSQEGRWRLCSISPTTGGIFFPGIHA